jgi:hypothetical protein
MRAGLLPGARGGLRVAGDEVGRGRICAQLAGQERAQDLLDARGGGPSG